jgi:hypothetical protein
MGITQDGMYAPTATDGYLPAIYVNDSVWSVDTFLRVERGLARIRKR